MNFFYIVLILFVFTTACKNNYPSSQNNSAPTEKTAISDSVLSPKARFLIQRAEQLNYIPNQEMISEYHLRKIGDDYFVGGFIKADREISEDLRNAGALVGSHAGQIYSVKIPLKKIRRIAAIPGITSIELEHQAHLK